MANPSRSLVLGIDGGGTKTLAWLAELDDQGGPSVLGRGTAGSSNKVAVGTDVALANLAAATQNAFSAAQIEPTSLSSAVFALAGSGTSEVQQQVERFAKTTLQATSACVIHDGQAVLEAGTPEGRGIALIAGTGAVAYGQNPRGETAVVGGWGYWFGDEGSAYWIGQSALRAVSHAADGRGAETLLTSAIATRLQATNPRDFLTSLSHQDNTRQAIAELADLVCVAAEQQDPVAMQILAETVNHWCQHIRCLAKQLMGDEPFALALAGGVLCGSDSARMALQKRLDQEQISFTSVELVPEPVLGCVKLACRDLQGAG